MKLRLAAASLLAITLAVTVAFACGPDLPWAAFTHQRHPDTPLVPYAGGQLGVLQPTYARSYLVVAYRWLSGVPLTKDEQSAAVDMWRRRSEAWWSGPAAEESAPAEWMAARAQLAGLPPVPEVLLSHVREGSYTLSQPAGLESFRAATSRAEPAARRRECAQRLVARLGAGAGHGVRDRGGRGPVAGRLACRAHRSRPAVPARGRGVSSRCLRRCRAGGFDCWPPVPARA